MESKSEDSLLELLLYSPVGLFLVMIIGISLLSGIFSCKLLNDQSDDDVQRFLKKFQSTYWVYENDLDNNCIICLEDFCTTVKVKKLPCSHTFHVDCIDRWFINCLNKDETPICPVCRRSYHMNLTV